MLLLMNSVKTVKVTTTVLQKEVMLRIVILNYPVIEEEEGSKEAEGMTPYHFLSMLKEEWNYLTPLREMRE